MTSMKDPDMTSTVYQVITKQFLESALNLNIKRFNITSGVKPGDNFMSNLYSILVEIQSEDEIPQNCHYLIKCYPSDPSQQRFLNKANHFYNELCFYTTLAKDLFQFLKIRNFSDSQISLAFPPFHAGKAVNFQEDLNDILSEKIHSPIDNFILMTDLRNDLGYKMGPREMDFEHVKLAFIELAKMHAVSWAYKENCEEKDENLISKYPFLKRMPNPRKIEMWLELLKKNGLKAVEAIDKVKGKGNLWSKSIQQFCVKGKAVLEYNSNAGAEEENEVKKLLRIQTEFDSDIHWRVICHGDIWSNNMLFKYEKETGSPENVILVDFPLVKLACPTVDLACLVYTSTRTDFRKKHLDNCLQIYHDKFLDICEQMKVGILPGFNVSSLKSRFRVSVLVALVIAVISFPEDLKHVMEKPNEKTGEKLQKHSRDLSLYEEWIVELVEDVSNEGII